MPRTGLVLHVTHAYLLVGEACREFLRSREHASAVVAQVDDESVAGREEKQYLVHIAVARSCGERLAAQVARVVVEHAVFHSRRYAVVRAKVFSYKRVAAV